jgi:hypothetical protein
MSRSPLRALQVALGLFAVTLLASCSSHPTAPTTSAPREPDFVRVPMQVSASRGESQGGAIRSSDLIDGDEGGTVVVGRFSLVVPPGAFDGVATVTITVPDPGVLKCELDLTNVTNFVTPVSLVADCSGAAALDYTDVTALELDPASLTWQEVPGTTVDESGATVTAPLRTSAIYGIVQGKAGW